MVEYDEANHMVDCKLVTNCPPTPLVAGWLFQATSLWFCITREFLVRRLRIDGMIVLAEIVPQC